MGGKKQAGSKMIVACENVCVPTRGGWRDARPPRKFFEFTSSQIAIWAKLSKQIVDDTYLCSVT